MKIRISDLSFSYSTGVKAVDNVSMNIDTGEIVALVGENGAGKSTLVKHLNGLLRADKGDVLIGDWDVADFSTAQLAERVSFLCKKQNPPRRN